MTNDLFAGDFEGSLNAGSELDDELPQEPLAPVETPLLVGELQTLTAMEARLEDLNYLVSDIRETGGMHQGFALEAQRLVPGFERKAPLGYYTEAPTQTRYRVSLEALHHQIWEMIKAAAKTLVESIQRWIAWFHKNTASAQQSPGAVAQEMGQRAAANAKVMAEAQRSMSELAEATKSGQVQSTAPTQARVLPNFDALVAMLLKDSPRYARHEGFFGQATSVHHDIVESGPYTDAFLWITPALPAVRNMLEERVKVLTQYIDELDARQSVAQKVVAMRGASILAKPAEISYARRQTTLHEAADYLSRIRQEIQGQEPTKKLDLDYVSLAVSEAYRKNHVASFFYEQSQILVVMAQLAEKLTELQKKLPEFSGNQDPQTEALANTLREAVFALAKDVNGYQQLFAELRQYGQALERLTQETLHMAQAVDHELLILVSRGLLKAPPGWVERAKKMREHRIANLFGPAAA